MINANSLVARELKRGRLRVLILHKSWRYQPCNPFFEDLPKVCSNFKAWHRTDCCLSIQLFCCFLHRCFESALVGDFSVLCRNTVLVVKAASSFQQFIYSHSSLFSFLIFPPQVQNVLASWLLAAVFSCLFKCNQKQYFLFPSWILIVLSVN